MANTPTPNVGLNKPAQGDTPWDATVNGNMDRLDAIFGGTFVVPAIAPTSLKPNNVVTINAGVPALVAKADATAQAANIGSTLLYAVPASGAGMYRITGYVVITQAATVSSTMPALNFTYTDNDTGAAAALIQTTNSSTANVVGTTSSSTSTGLGQGIINAKASSNINWQTVAYASSGATPMQFAVHIKLEYLGN